MKPELEHVNEAGSANGSEASTAPKAKGRKSKGHVVVQATLRGLGSVVHDMTTEDNKEIALAGPGLVVNVPLDQIDENPGNARQDFDKEELEALAQSIRERGLIQPIVVREAGGRYVVVAGHRRLRAHQMIGLAKIPALVRADTDRGGDVADGAIENLQRAQLKPYEEARAFQALVEQGKTQEQVAQETGKSLATVRRRLQLMRLPAPIARQVGSKGFSQEHADVLLPIADKPEFLEAAAEAIREESKYGDGAMEVYEFQDAVAGKLLQKKLVKRLPMSWEIGELKSYDKGLAKKLKAVPVLKLGDGGTYALDAKALDAALHDARAAKHKKDAAAAKRRGGGSNRPVYDHELDNMKRAEMDKLRAALIVKATKGVVDLGLREMRALFHVVVARVHDRSDGAVPFFVEASGLPEADVKALLSSRQKDHAKAVERLLKAKDQTPLVRLLVALSLQTTVNEWADGPAATVRNEICEEWLAKTPADIEREAMKVATAARAAQKKAAKDGKATTAAAEVVEDEDDGEVEGADGEEPIEEEADE